jgi:putative PEP-CTERM system histidine kinase
MGSNVGFLSYAFAGTVFFVAAFTLVAVSRLRHPGMLLSIACLAASAWAWLCALTGFSPYPNVLVDLAEITRNTIFLLFIADGLGGFGDGDGSARARTRTLQFVILTAGALGIGVRFAADSWGPGVTATMILHALTAIAGMFMVEQLFRNVHQDSRWGIKFLCIGLGTIFAYDFFLYSQALLYVSVNINLWDARGLVSAVAAPLIIASASRNPQWAIRIKLSRHAAFHTMTLFGAGTYLVVMALTGYYLRVAGGSWGAVLQIFFFFATSVLLATLLFSGKIRARLRVMLSKHFFSHQYDYREEWLRLNRTILSFESSDQIYEAAIRAIAALVESPGGALWIAKNSAQNHQFVAKVNMQVPDHDLPTDDSMAVFMKDTGWIINLDEYEPGHKNYRGMTLPAWINEIQDAWLIVPLALQGRLLGFVILSQPLVKMEFNWEVGDLLKAAAHQLANTLAQKQASEALLVAKQFDSMNRMSAFIVHDLKNLVAQLSLMLSNAEKHKANPEFQDDMIETVENSVAKMNRMLLQLKRGDAQDNTPGLVKLDEIVKDALRSKSSLKPVPSLIVDSSPQAMADHEKLVRVVGHVIQNACEATPYDGKVSVRISTLDDGAVIEVKDTGQGMEASFVRERLFKPFDSTKRSGMGIGAYECQEYMRELGGRVEVESAPGQGTLFRLTLPSRRQDFATQTG